MKNGLSPSFRGETLRNAMMLLIALTLLLMSVSPAVAQQKEKKKKKDAAADSGGPIIPLTDEQQIDYMISEMLGAWQLGDIERLHRAYADDVVVVSGAYAPPVIGWNTMGLFGSRGRPAFRGAGANDACAGEAQQPLGDCPQPHFSRAIGPAG